MILLCLLFVYEKVALGGYPALPADKAAGIAVEGIVSAEGTGIVYYGKGTGKQVRQDVPAC